MAKEWEFNRANIDKLPFAEKDATGRVKTYARRDPKTPGLMVTVSSKSKSYAVQCDVYSNKERDRDTGWRKKLGTKRVRLGHIDDFDDIPAVRQRARDEMRKIRENADTGGDRAPTWKRLTLRDAWNRYEKFLVKKQRSPATIHGYSYKLDHYWGAWWDRTLVAIGEDPDAVEARHDEITENSGPVAANHALRALRAVYGFSKRKHKGLPDNPVSAADFHHEAGRKDTSMAPADLPDWWAQVAALSNPIRRDAQLMALLSGLRAGKDGGRGGKDGGRGVGYGVVSLRWEHVDWDKRALRLPTTKTGHALVIPLSRAMVEILQRRHADNEMLFAASPWVFPADSQSGHVWSLHERSGARRRVTFTGHTLRHTYVSLGQAAGVPREVVSRLVGHSGGGNQTEHYTDVEAQLDFLRGAQETISRYLLVAMGHPSVSGEQKVVELHTT